MKINGTIFNFITFKNSLDFASNIYHKCKTLLKDFQYKMFGLLKNFKKYEPKNPKKIKSKRGTN